MSDAGDQITEDVKMNFEGVAATNEESERDVVEQSNEEQQVKFLPGNGQKDYVQDTVEHGDNTDAEIITPDHREGADDDVKLDAGNEITCHGSEDADAESQLQETQVKVAKVEEPPVAEDESDNDSQWETDGDGSGSSDSGSVNAESAEELFRKLSAENRIAHRTIDNNDLPGTVSVLDGKNGAKIYLIGTAHFSKESCEDVRKVITQAQPDVVMIELCRGRTDLLINDEETLAKLAGDVSFDKIIKQIRHKGFVSGLMTFLLLHMSAHITKQLGMAPGGEFRAAYQESRRVPGCKLLFGDRAVEVTLQRAFSTFSIWQKLKFALCILKDLGPIKPEDIEKLKEKDMLEQALGEMMGEFPEMTSVFLVERDVYLAHSLQVAASNIVRTEDSLAPTVVVGVVGLGHVAGIKENFQRDISMEEMKKLVDVPKPSRMRSLMKTAIKVSLFACMFYGAYRFTCWTGVFQGIRSLYAWSGIGLYLPNWVQEPNSSLVDTQEHA